MIAILTDFGVRDPFVGIMKGVIAGISPDAQLIDLTHEIPPQDVRHAALVLGDSYRYFPECTVFLCVVDPGVGSARRPVCVCAGGYFFVGPDNGTFSVPMAELGFRAWTISQSRYMRKVEGGTFHGRDIFAPAAAWLSKGIEPSALGPEAGGLVTLEFPKPETKDGTLVGEVLMLDRFGNAITNIRKHDVSGQGSVSVRGVTVPLVTHYAACGSGSPGALMNSSGRLEVFVNMGSAAGVLGIRAGDEVRLLPDFA